MTSPGPSPRSRACAGADYAVVASQVSLPVELRQGETGRWAGYLVQAVDDAYLENIDYDIAVKAEGYTTAAEIWEAVREHRGYAVIDRYAVPSRSTTSIMIGGPDFKLKGVYLEDETMQPIRLNVREPNSEATFELTIIGVLEQSAITGFGLVTSQETLEKALPSKCRRPPTSSAWRRASMRARPAPRWRAPS